jgi:hypothetical protein
VAETAGLEARDVMVAAQVCIEAGCRSMACPRGATEASLEVHSCAG